MVLSLAQTADGFLWVGTTEGLYRFDGMTFEAYKPEAGNFPATGIYTLEAAPDGLWIGYLSGGVSVLKNGRLKNYSERDGLPISRIRSIVHTEDGKVWVAAVGGVARLEGDHWQKGPHGLEFHGKDRKRAWWWIRAAHCGPRWEPGSSICRKVRTVSRTRAFDGHAISSLAPSAGWIDGLHGLSERQAGRRTFADCR